MIKEINHTADVGYIVESKSIESLIKESIIGFYKVILINLPKRKLKELEIKKKISDLEFLIHEILEDLLINFEKNLEVWIPKEVKIENSELLIKFNIFKVKDKKDVRILPKAITWNKFKLLKDNETYRLCVIIDV